MSNRKFDVEEKVAVNLYSTHDILRSMTEFYEEALPQVGQAVTQKWSNIKLALMFVACSAGLYGQFGAKFPQDWHLIAMCVGSYFLISGALTLMEYFITKGSVLVLRDKGVDVFVGLQMKDGESHVTMSLRRKERSEEYKVEIDKLFESNGVLNQTATLNVFNQNLASFLKSNKKKD